VADAFLPGPLARALTSGGLLYVEEINRVPEETLNVLITVMSEGELHVPRLPMISAHPEFRLVAAMNPFDAIGTARISGAVYDRCCRLQVGYQPSEVEARIVARRAQVGPALAEPTIAAIVELVRATRDHPDLRSGSSVRGAIDSALVMSSLAGLRSAAPESRAVSLDAVTLALSGRVRVRDGSSRTAEAIIAELWERHLSDLDPESSPGSGADPGVNPDDGQGDSGKALGSTAPANR
jgi:MoxR-like ATPase